MIHFTPSRARRGRKDDPHRRRAGRRGWAVARGDPTTRVRASGFVRAVDSIGTGARGPNSSRADDGAVSQRLLAALSASASLATTPPAAKQQLHRRRPVTRADVSRAPSAVRDRHDASWPTGSSERSVTWHPRSRSEARGHSPRAYGGSSIEAVARQRPLAKTCARPCAAAHAHEGASEGRRAMQLLRTSPVIGRSRKTQAG